MVDAATHHIAFEETAGQRCASVRAFVCQGVEAAVDVKHPNHQFVDDKHPGFPFRDVTDVAYGVVFRHEVAFFGGPTPILPATDETR